MKHLRKFDSVADLNAAIANSTIGMIGLAYNNGTPVMKKKDGGSPVPPAPDPTTPFYVENITQETETLTITSYDNTGSEPASYLEIPVEYSTDGTNWSSLGTTGATPLTRTLKPGDKVYLRAITNAWYEFQDEPYIDHGCTILGVSKVGGNVMSLLYGSSFTGNETTFPSGSIANFVCLFVDMNDEDGYNRNLVSASELILPATTLADGCYSDMFDSCTSLTSAPALPATTLAQFCYSVMFNGCTSLATAPALPATTLTESCYGGMFQGCTSLTSAPALPATTLANNCYEFMFQGCTSLTSAPALPATTLADYCYLRMFYGCTSLTTAPALPATTLANNCYEFMFRNCTSLATAPALPATTLAEGCYSDMFDSCTSLTSAPALPATTLADYCYLRMFYGCTNLNYIKCLATDISANDCTSNWVSNVAATGTFVKDPNMSGWTTGNNGIPSGWTVKDATE